MGDLLSFIGMATKRREDYFSQAESLAKKCKDQPTLEERMRVESNALVKGYRDKLMRWEEYERSLLDKTLVSALASVYLGSEKDRPKEKMEKAWPTIVGDMIPPLVKFLGETKEYVDSGVLRLGDQTEEFAEGPPGRTWRSLANRVARYLATPTFSFFNLGEFYMSLDQGFKEMKRISHHDEQSCKDCESYSSQGWKPMGTLPMPGRDCQCYDNCRCYVEYR